jgi:hypothetical protein
LAEAGTEIHLQKSRPTQNKRARERARQERAQHKQVRRQEAKSRKGGASHATPGEDPDIAGIVPGPQPNPWGDELEVEPEAEAEDDER